VDPLKSCPNSTFARLSVAHLSNRISRFTTTLRRFTAQVSPASGLRRRRGLSRLARISPWFSQSANRGFFQCSHRAILVDDGAQAHAGLGKRHHRCSRASLPTKRCPPSTFSRASGAVVGEHFPDALFNSMPDDDAARPLAQPDYPPTTPRLRGINPDSALLATLSIAVANEHSDQAICRAAGKNNTCCCHC
jgi:hypothetical protein